VVFTDTSAAPTSITAWQWSFGDGVTSTQQNPTHVYSHAGAYTVRLTTGTGVYTDTETKLGYVTVIPPSGPRVITYTYDGLNRLKRTGYSSGE
jgi:PKD repeat protein